MGRVHTRLYLSDESRCLTAGSVTLLKQLPTFACDIELNDRFWSRIQVCKIELFGTEYWADKVTGSLYDIETLRCLSGNLRISSPIVSVKAGKKAEVAHV